MTRDHPWCADAARARGANLESDGALWPAAHTAAGAPNRSTATTRRDNFRLGTFNFS
jgi:hypothetical protein